MFIFYRCFASRLHFGRRSGTQLPGHGAAVLCQVGYAVLNVVTWLPWFRELPAENYANFWRDMYGICMVYVWNMYEIVDLHAFQIVSNRHEVV